MLSFFNTGSAVLVYLFIYLKSTTDEGPKLHLHKKYTHIHNTEKYKQHEETGAKDIKHKIIQSSIIDQTEKVQKLF